MSEESSVKSQVSEKGADGVNEELNYKVQISGGELQAIINIIDISTQRGAFRAPELKGVGEFYEKLVSLVKNNKQ